MAGRRKKKVRTSAQRAALKKAQAASARKRRRRRVKRNAKTGARIVGSFAGAALAYHINNYARKPKKLKTDYRAAKSGIKNYRQRRLTKGLPPPVIPTTNWAKRGYL